MSSGRAGRIPALRVWRLTSARYAATAFDGEGARQYGGRWNHPGVALVYTSHALSLCALEYFVHLEPEVAPHGLVAVAADIPAGLEIASREIKDLPADWRAYPAPERLKDVGTAWARAGESAVLSIPSSIVPQERNYLINPSHPGFAQIRLLPAEPFSFDPRMWK